MRDPAQCANCRRPATDAGQHFCPDCGQPTPAPRIDWRFLGQQLADSVLSMERGIAYSLVQLMLRPGHLARDYIEGRRGRQAKPLLLLTITAALVVFLSRSLLEGNVIDAAMSLGGGDAYPRAAEGHDEAARLVAFFEAVRRWMDLHFAAATLLLLPLEAAAFKLAFRRFRDVNYPEWLVLATFLTVQTFVLWMLLILLHRWLPHEHWLLPLSIAYGVFTVVQFFPGYPRWKSGLRTIAGFALFLLSSLLLSVIAAVVVLVLQPPG